MLKKIYYWLHKRFSRPEERGEYSKGYWQDRTRQEALILCRGIKGRLLEIGCGEGLFLGQLAGQNPDLELWGVDNNSLRLKQAQMRLSKNLSQINLSLQEAAKVSFGNEFFDAVVCINVFFNMDSIDRVKEILIQMKRICKKSGRIIFDYRNADNFLVLLKYRLARYYDETVKGLPLSCFSPVQVESILKDLELKIAHRIYIGLPFLRKSAPIILMEAEKK